jgi:ABC-type molybdate transport system substrate-binding protein
MNGYMGLRPTSRKNDASCLSPVRGFAVCALRYQFRNNYASDVQVAVAANFTEPARETATVQTRATGHNAVLSFGSSGAFYTQIATERPSKCFSAERRSAQEDLSCQSRARFTYAIGQLVLFRDSRSCRQ